MCFLSTTLFGLSPAWMSLAVFLAAYVLFAVFPNYRAWVACGGSVLLVMTGVLTPGAALFEKVNWNVMGLFFGTLILADLFLKSRVPAVFAQWLVARCATGRMALLAICLLAGVLSIVVENVAVVLLVAPVALSLAEKLKVNPSPLLVGIAISSNLQGTATMIGDPPSMILAGAMHLGFWDFFWYQGRPGIFFAIQAGAIVSLFVLAFCFRNCKGRGTVELHETARSWTPASLLGLLIVGLSFSSFIDHDFCWFAGSFTLLVSLIAVLWYRLYAKLGKAHRLFRALDWNTTFFLIGVFILVGALSDSGWMDLLAKHMDAMSGGSPLMAFVLIVAFAVVISGFIDNTPFLLVMIPVAQKMAGQISAPVPLLMFGLLIGACLGGNITPIGASANVVALGILRKQHITVSFRDFMSLSVPFTIAAVLAGCAFIWAFWGC